VNNSLLAITNMDIDNMYCTCNGMIFSSFNKVRQEALFVEFAIIVIILLCILNIFILYGGLTPEYYSICYYRMYIGEIHHL
jgi:hypothetical protein